MRSFVVATLLLIAVSRASGVEPLAWFVDDRPTATARQAVEILQNAASEGLDPQDYDADALRHALSAHGAPVSDIAAALTAAMERFLLDVNRGRVDPVAMGEHFPGNFKHRLDTRKLLQEAMESGLIESAVAAARPRDEQYAALRGALSRYRALANDSAWAAALPPLPGRKLSSGQSWPGVGRLMRRLEDLGDLPRGSRVPTVYEGEAVAAVRAFQRRHGLTPDGVIGKATFEALAVTPGERAHQIALALERLRWTPRPDRAIVVNVPEFMLRAYSDRQGQRAEFLAMRVIVGKAAKTPTPIFSAAMRYIEFSPYWNVPPSIARGETIPRLGKDPAYFDEQGFEFVSGGGEVSTQLTEANLAATLQGRLRIRQRPGPKNALGDIKFVFPNSDDIYLHHTPTPQLFKRDRRDFSHGCIRVEDPLALASFVLAGQPGWDQPRIVEAMRRGTFSTVQLADILPVVIAYRTAAVDDGQVRFFPDIYGLDARLSEALNQRSRIHQDHGILK